MSIAAKPKKPLEQAATIKGVGTTAAEATAAALAFDAVASDVECTNDVRGRCVYYRDELRAANAAGDSKKRETVAAAAGTFAGNNV